jgi:hypothetical protein
MKEPRPIRKPLKRYEYYVQVMIRYRDTGYQKGAKAGTIMSHSDAVNFFNTVTAGWAMKPDHEYPMDDKGDPPPEDFSQYEVFQSDGQASGTPYVPKPLPLPKE